MPWRDYTRLGRSLFILISLEAAVWFLDETESKYVWKLLQFIMNKICDTVEEMIDSVLKIRFGTRIASFAFYSH